MKAQIFYRVMIEFDLTVCIVFYKRFIATLILILVLF